MPSEKKINYEKMEKIYKGTAELLKEIRVIEKLWWSVDMWLEAFGVPVTQVKLIDNARDLRLQELRILVADTLRVTMQAIE